MKPRRILRVGLISLGVVVVLAAAAIAALVWRFDPNSYKPQIEAAARRALGRDVTLNGPVGLSLSLRPTITVRDAVLTNPPGFPTPVMAQVKEIDLRFDLPALLGRRLVVQQLVLDTPEIELERNSAGEGNWVITPPRPAVQTGAAAPEEPAKTHSAPMPFLIQKVEVQHATITYRDDKTALVRTVDIPHVELTAASPDSRVHLAATASAGSDRFDLTAETAPLNRLLAGAGAWPLTAKLHASGTIYDATVDLSVPQADQPLAVALAGTLRGKPFSVNAQFGAAGAALGTKTKLPISLQAQAADAALAAQGSVADLDNLTGVDIALSGQAANLADLGAFLGKPLPALRKLTFSGQLSDVGGLGHGAELRQFRLMAEQGDLAGDAQAAYSGRRSVRAELTGSRLDLSALHVPASKAPPGAPTGAAPSPGPPPSAADHLISDAPLPFATLREADAEISLKLGAVQSGKATLLNVLATTQLAHGVLALKAQGLLGGGAVALTATADAERNPPAVALAISAPSLPVAALLTALGSPDYASGNLTLAVNVSGAGTSPHAIAAGLNGQVMLTVQGGTIDTRLLEHTLGPAIAQANPLALLSNGEVSELRCVAARASIANGQVTLAPLLLSSGLITVSGSGTANLASETLNLHLRPEGRAGGVAFSVPMTVTGSFRAPRAVLARNSAANAGAAVVLGLLAGKNAGGALSGALGETGSSCPAALAEARGAAPPQPVSRPASPATSRLPEAGALLRQLLH